MIARIWHGWTTLENADVYEQLLREQIFPGIEAKGVDGFIGIQMMRSPVGGDEYMDLPPEEVEFVTTMWFSSWDAVKAFAGEDYEQAYVPDAARALLARFDETAKHYEVREDRLP